MLEIDGSQGEGGGQIVRSTFALAMLTGRAVRIRNVRAGRRKPGLLRQHLTALEAAKAICGARVEGAALGSRELVFEPGSVRAGDYRFSIGTAGSTTLVVQAVLPALLTADGPSRLTLDGGTHNPAAPPYEFLAHTLVPLIERMGPRIKTRLARPGFYPAGGGRLVVEIEPVAALAPLELTNRGEILECRGRVLLAHLPAHVGKRELRALERLIGWEDLRLEPVEDSAGPGNAVLLEVMSEHVTEVFSGIGTRGVAAEKVAKDAVDALRRYLEAEVPVGVYLADQLLLPLAMAGGGTLLTMPLSRHTTTQIELLARFLDVPIRVERVGPRQTRVEIGV